MGDPIQIVSTAPQKRMEEMSDGELVVSINDLSEVHDYLTREEASYEERCFAESIKNQIDARRKHLEGRTR